MYKAYINDNLFFDTDSLLDEYSLISASLELEAGTAGMFQFDIAPNNVAYSTLNTLTSYVDLYRDSELVFSGRVYSISEGFNTCLTVICEGLLTILNDSIIRPRTYNDALSGILTRFLYEHNSQVGSDKQVQLGEITVDDVIIYRNYEMYSSTMERLQDLADTFGGYFSIRKSGGSLYLDWTAEYDTRNSQSIDFGQNLLDVHQEQNASDIITVLIPLGAEIEQNDGTRTRLTIAGVQEQQGLDYLEDADGIAEFGRIVGTVEWDDVTVDTNLRQKGIAYLNAQSQSRVSITVNAVDLAGINQSIDAFKVGTIIRVTSEAHGLADDFTCLSQTLNLLDPSQDVLVLSNLQYGYITRQARAMRKLVETQNSIVSNYALNTELSTTANTLQQQITTNTTAIEQNANDITLRATTEDLNALASQLAELQVQSDNISLYFGEDGLLSTWFKFDADSLTIGKADSEYHTEQDNESYSIVDSSGNILFTVTPDGTKQETADVDRQVRFSYGGAGQWAIREGEYIQGVGVNLNDVWIGG